MAYDYVDVYAIVNDIGKQALGSKAVDVIDTNSFVDFGNNVLSSSDATESFMDTLLLRIASTYFTFRPYNAKLRNLIVSGSEWAAIYQKIDGSVGDFIEDETFNLVEGQSIDMYIVRKPRANQKLFVKKAHYSNFITYQRKTLQGAFTSEAAFAQFISMINGKMRTKLDFAQENMARLAMANYIANMGSAQKVHLLTGYNTITGQSLTKAQAYVNKDFLAWAAGQVELHTKRLGDLSVLNNKEGLERHTPERDLRFVVFDEFSTAMQYCLQYQAFHEDLVKLREYSEVSYWQGEQNRDKIHVTVEGDETTEEIVVNDIVAFAFDRFALGTFRSDEETATTPYNARGRYYNTFYHADQLWYNDLSENAVLFLMD